MHMQAAISEKTVAAQTPNEYEEWWTRATISETRLHNQKVFLKSELTIEGHDE